MMTALVAGFVGICERRGDPIEPGQAVGLEVGAAEWSHVKCIEDALYGATS